MVREGASLRKAKRVMTMACILLGIVAVMAVIGPVISPYGYEETSEIQFGAPSAKHWFGTDLHGRDLFTRVLFGARISLLVGIVGTSISLIVGVSYGIISGYIGGKVDSWMMRLVDVLYALPRIVLVIVVIAVFDSQVKDLLHASAWSEAVPYTRLVLMFISLGMVEWLTMARIVRGQVLSLRSREFIQAAQSLGQRPWKIVGKHLLPNLRGVIIVYLTLTVPAVILEESFLSFLGLGIQPPQSSWGTLLADGASVINPIRSYWWVMMGPALFMAITLFALNYLGDALRDYFELDDQSVK